MRFVANQLLTYAATRAPDREALRCRDRTMTYAELDHASDCIAAALADRGVGPGDRVGVYLPKGFEAVTAVYGAMKAGAVYVPFDALAPPALAATMARDAEISALVSTVPGAAALLAEARDALDLNVVIAVRVESREAPPPAALRDRLDYEEVVRSGGRPPQVARSEIDLCCIAYTSGSTGAPKGVMVTHRAVVAAVEWFVWRMGLTEDDRLGQHPPLHVLLSAYTLFGAAAAGATSVLITEEEARWGSELVRIVRDERVSVWFSVTAALVQMLRAGAVPGSLPSLRAIAFGGASSAPSDVSGIVELFRGARFFHILGTSESWHNSCFPFTELDVDDRPLPLGVSAENVDSFLVTDDGRLAGPGEEGELHVRSPSMMRGYWRRPDLTAGVLVSHPLDASSDELVHRTGDVLRLRADGVREFVGRRDLMVKTRGHRVEPEQVERAINDHPLVREAVVVAVPDADWGAALAAQVVPVSGAELDALEVRVHVGARLPGYMVPADVRIVESLPMTSAGKVDRAQVRTEMAATGDRS